MADKSRIYYTDSFSGGILAADIMLDQIEEIFAK